MYLNIIITDALTCNVTAGGGGAHFNYFTYSWIVGSARVHVLFVKSESVKLQIHVVK